MQMFDRMAVMLLLLTTSHLPAWSESNEEFGKRLHSALQDFKRQTDQQKTMQQRPPRVETIDSNGVHERTGSWEDVRPNRSASNDPPVVAPPAPDPEAEADAAVTRGDYDQALRLLKQALATTTDARSLVYKMNVICAAKLTQEVRAVNARRAEELNGVLKQAEQNLPMQLRSVAPNVALAAAQFERPSETTLVDLRGAQSFVVDPAFFRGVGTGGAAANTGATANTQAARRFIEPPEPGKTLSPVAFAGSPYTAVFETPEFEALMLSGLNAPVAEPVNRVRVAFFKRLDALPPQPIHVVTTAEDAMFEASRLQVKAAYEEYRKRRAHFLHVAGDASLKAMRTMLDGMENEGWFKPGDNLLAKVESDPVLKATLDERARLVRWYAELYLDEAEDRAYRELADRVTSIMKENTKP